jgi:hypothetical protein
MIVTTTCPATPAIYLVGAFGPDGQSDGQLLQLTGELLAHKQQSQKTCSAPNRTVSDNRRVAATLHFTKEYLRHL